LTFVDVGFPNKLGQQDYPLDITLRNTGKGTAYIKRADLKVEKIWTLTPPFFSPRSQCVFAAPTHKYQMKLPTSGAPFLRTEKLSQKVKSGDVDRFTIGFEYGNLRQVYFKDSVFLATLTLVYGEDNKEMSKDVLFASSQIGCDLFYKPGKERTLRRGLGDSDADTLASQNKQALEEIAHTEAVESQYIQRLIATGERPIISSASESGSAIASASATPKPLEQHRGGSRDREDVYEIGEKIRVGGVTYTATDAQLANELRGDTCSIENHPHGQGGPRVLENAIAVEILFTNDGSERIKFRDLGLHVYDSKGRQYEPQNMFGGICNEKDIFQRKRLEPGASQEAQVYYFVPLDASGFELEVAFESHSGNVARIKLGF